MHTPMRAAVFGLAFIGTASAVSLSSFTPRIDNLPTLCNSVYTSVIDGCTADDFKPKAVCSSACRTDLLRITEQVLSRCANVDSGETSIIGVFQNGIGLQALCPNQAVTTKPPTPPTSTKPSTPPSPPSPPPPPPSSSQATTSSSSTTSTSQTQTAASSSAASSSSGLGTDPNATKSVSGPAPTTVAPPSPPPPPGSNIAPAPAPGTTQAAAKPQLSNADSGGGSPFDVVAASSSSQLRSLDTVLAVVMAWTLLFVTSS